MKQDANPFPPLPWWPFLAALFFAAPVYGVSLVPGDCNAMSGFEEACQAILDEPSLSAEERKQLFAELVAGNTDLPNHENIEAWNATQNVVNPPAGTEKKSDGIIKDAWLAILEVRPSIYDTVQNKWWLDKTGEIELDYDHRVQIPSGNAPGDCQTTYLATPVAKQLSVRRNGSLIGSGKVSTFSAVEGVNTFTASLSLSTTLTTNHYRIQTVCNMVGEELVCTNVCQFDNSEQDFYSVDLFDAFPANYLEPGQELDFLFEEREGLDALKLELVTQNPVNEFSLQLDDAAYVLSEVDYGVGIMNSPYEFLYATRRQNFTKEKRNLVETDFSRVKVGNGYRYEIELGLDKKPESCSILAFNGFGVEDLGDVCRFTPLKDTSLELTSNEKEYDFEEPLIVKATLRDDEGKGIPFAPLQLKAGAYSDTLTTAPDGVVTYTLRAKDTLGLISVEFDHDENYASARAEKRVILRKQANWDVAVAVVSLLAVNFFIYLLLKKYGRWEL